MLKKAVPAHVLNAQPVPFPPLKVLPPPLLANNAVPDHITVNLVLILALLALQEPILEQLVLLLQVFVRNAKLGIFHQMKALTIKMLAKSVVKARIPALLGLNLALNALLVPILPQLVKPIQRPVKSVKSVLIVRS